MPRLMLLRFKYDEEVTAWVQGRPDYGTGSGSTAGAAVEALMSHINSTRLREQFRKSLQVTA